MKINSKIECHLSCLECSGGGINDCLKCSPNFYTHNGQCLAECPDGYYKDASLGECSNCPQLCLTCSSGNFLHQKLSFFFIILISLI